MAEFSDANSFLMGGGGAPSAKFPTFGTTTTGTICLQPEVQQQRDFNSSEPKFYPDGNPMLQLVVTVQTEQRDPAIQDDDGRRRLFIKGAMKVAIQQAVQQAGAQGLEVGGRLTVTYSGDGERKGNLNPPKLFKAAYVPAATAALQQPPQQQVPAGVNPATGEVVNPAAYAAATAPGAQAPVPALAPAPVGINAQTGQPWTPEQITAMQQLGIPIPGLQAATAAPQF